MGRPAIIITGFMPASELPLPMTIDGVTAESSSGLVMVRWIYPIPDEADSTTLSPDRNPEEEKSSSTDLPRDTRNG